MKWNLVFKYVKRTIKKSWLNFLNKVPSKHLQTLISFFNFILVREQIYIWFLISFAFSFNFVPYVYQWNLHFLHHEICLKSRITLKFHFSFLLWCETIIDFFLSILAKSYFAISWLCFCWCRLNAWNRQTSWCWAGRDWKCLNGFTCRWWWNSNTTLWRRRYVVSLFGSRCYWSLLRSRFLLFAPINITCSNSFAFFYVSSATLWCF